MNLTDATIMGKLPSAATKALLTDGHCSRGRFRFPTIIVRATRSVLALFSMWLVAEATLPSVYGNSAPSVAEIVRDLDSDSFWTNRPILVRFSEQVEVFGSDKATSDKSAYICSGLLLEEGFKGLKLLDNTQTASTNEILPDKKVFVSSNAYNMSYFLYSTNTHSIDYSKKGSRIRGNRANAGEAIVGVSECKCDERFWPFPLTPSVVARKLENLRNATCTQTNLGNNSVIQVVGEAADEPPGIEWRIYLSKTNSFWFPVVSEVFFQNEPISIIKTTFDFNAGHFAPKTIQNTVLLGKEIVGVFRWSNITAQLGETADHFSGVEIIPERVIVNDYRFKKPVAFVMGGRQPTDTELAQMAENSAAVRRYQEGARTDTPLGYRSSTRQSDARRPFVRAFVVVMAILTIPLLWLAIKLSRNRG